jgi:plasmid stabilization system protein ParE
MKEIRWTNTAKLSLKNTAEFTIEVWNDKVLDTFLDQLDFRISQLQNNPQLGKSFQNSHFRRLVIHKTISLFYVVKPEYIKLLLIWDNRANPDDLYEKLTHANKT